MSKDFDIVLEARKNIGLSDYNRDKDLKSPPGLEVISDLKYGRNNPFNLLDISYPSSKSLKEKLPVIVNIHGGGFIYGYKEVYKYYCAYLALQGFKVININYSLAPEKKFPTQLFEVNKVFDFIYKNRDKYGLDINNIFVIGDSAGAELAMHYLVIKSNPKFRALFNMEVNNLIKVKACALNCGYYDTSRWITKKTEDGFEGDVYIGKFRKFKLMPLLDAYNSINSSFPPTYLLSGYFDFLKENVIPMYKHLKERGVEVIYSIKEDEFNNDIYQHDFQVNMNLDISKKIVIEQTNFFKEHIN